MESENNLQELQMTEQGLQGIIYQKQAFQMEISETQAALKEIEKSGDEVFKIVGQLMIKTDKKILKEDLEKKQKLLNLRIDSLEKQEKELSEKLEKLQKELMKNVKK